MRDFILTYTEEMLNFSENQDLILDFQGRHESKFLTEVCIVSLILA